MKRKVLISVLAIALVLTLCIGIFAACDPKEPAKTEYTVTYSLGEFEGTGTAPAAQKVEEGSKIKLPAVGVTWADHDFLGWKAGADGELLQPETEVEVKADITYTAQWKENGEPELPKVTIYYTLGTELKSVVKSVMTTEESGKYQLNEPSGYVPDEDPNDYDAFMAQLGKAEEYKYYYYDATATDHKGDAFDYTQSFEAEADFSIIIIKEAFGVPSYGISTEWYGYFTSSNRGGSEYTLEINDGDGGMIMLDMTGGMGEPITQSIAAGMTADDPMIYQTNDAKSLILITKAFGGEGYEYYYITKNADGTMTVSYYGEETIFSPAEKPGPKVTATIYYVLNDELKSAPAEVMASGDAYKLSEVPEWYIPDSDPNDYDAFMAGLKYGTELKYYYYDAEKEDHKGTEFDADGTFTESVSIYIAIEAFATPLYTLDIKYHGTFTGTVVENKTFTLTIDTEKGTIKLEYNKTGNNEIDKTLPDPFTASIQDGTILTTTDGKIVFVEPSPTGNLAYAHYYYLSEEEGKFTVEYEGWPAAVELTKQKIEVTATIYYVLNDELKSAPAEVMASGDAYELSEVPEWYIPDQNPNDYDAFMAGLKYGTELKYYYYDAEKEDHKGTEFDADGTFTESVSIYIAIETFATPAKEIDAKYAGSFAGTLNGHAFILTIDATAKTINVDYGTALNPINASIEDGTILTQDGKLVFVEGTLQYVHYYYLTEKEGALTLDCEYTQEPIALVASLKNLVGTYKSTGGGTLVVTTYAAGEYVESYDFTASGSVIYNGELIKVAYGLNDGTWYIQGYHSEYETIQEDGDSYSMAKFFSATVSEGTIKVGETTAFTGRTDLVNADMSDFAGYYKQSDNNRYWSIKATQNEDHEDILKVTYGDANPQEANYAIIGDYIYLTYTSQSYTYAYLLQKGESDSLTGTYIAPEKAPVAITFNKADRYADKTNTYTYTPAEGATLDITVSAFGGTADLKITSILLNSFTAPTYAELTMAVGDGAAQTYKLWLEDDTLFKKLSLLIADKDYHVSSPLYTLQDVMGLKAHGFAIALTGEGKIEIYDTSSKEKLGELTNKSYTGGGTDTHPTDTVTYEGNVKVNDLLNVIITKLEFDNIPDPTTVTITGTFGGKEATTTTTLSSNNDYPGYLLEAPKGKPKHYWNVNFSNGGSSATFGIGIYEDGTVVVAEGSGDSYRGTLTKSGEKPAEPEQPKEEDVQITVKAGENCANKDWSKQITIKTGTRTCAEITELLGGEDQLPAGTNRYWYFAGYTVNGENYLKSKSIAITKETTEITLYYKDGQWEVYDKTYYTYLHTDHFGATTGELIYEDSETGEIATYTYTYNLEDNTITLVEKGGSGTEIKGTLTEKTEAGRTDASPHTFGINITLMYNGNPFTFGTGSPSTGGTTDTDPFAGTTWSGKADNINKTDVTIEFTADGTIKIQFGSYPELTGTYKYADAKLTVESEGNAMMTSVEITVTLTSDGKSINEFTIECDDEGSDGEHMTYHIKNPTKG